MSASVRRCSAPASEIRRSHRPASPPERPMKFDAIIFDFDGVLLESEYAGNKQIGDYLTRIGHPVPPEQAMTNFMGLSGGTFLAAIERYVGRPLPADFHAARAEED